MTLFFSACFLQKAGCPIFKNSGCILTGRRCLCSLSWLWLWSINIRYSRFKGIFCIFWNGGMHMVGLCIRDLTQYISPPAAFLHFKKYEKFLSTWSSLRKNYFNFIHPKLILHNQSHEIHSFVMLIKLFITYSEDLTIYWE